jgi:ABC-type branched-subunit amino acid transport system substrate-binding protein
MRGISRRKLLQQVGAATAVGSVGLAGCLSGDGGGNTEDEIVIACPTSLSGAFAPYGEAERDGGMLAAQHLEEELDLNIEIVTGDTELSPDTAIERLESMVVDDDATLAYGGVSSAIGIAMGNWASENEVPICVHGASDDITGSECAPFMFSPYMSNTMQVAPTAPQMADLEDDWYLLYSDYTWGHTAEEAYVEALEDEGAEIVGSEAVPFPNDDYTPYLNSAQQSGASGLALLVAGLDQRTATSQILDLGMEEEFSIMMHQGEDVGFYGIDPQMASILDINSQGWSPAIDAGEEWKNEVAEFSDHDPFVRHYMGYVSVDQMVRASVRADSLEGEAIRDELSGHEIESEQILELQPGERLYWREADNQLVQPTHVTTGRAVEDMQNDPYNVWFDMVDTMEGDDASPEPDEACDL